MLLNSQWSRQRPEPHWDQPSLVGLRGDGDEAQLGGLRGFVSRAENNPDRTQLAFGVRENHITRGEAPDILLEFAARLAPRARSREPKVRTLDLLPMCQRMIDPPESFVHARSTSICGTRAGFRPHPRWGSFRHTAARASGIAAPTGTRGCTTTSPARAGA